MNKSHVILTTFLKNLKTDIRAYPLSSLFSRIINGIFNIIFPLATYYLLFSGKTNEAFNSANGTSDYITYIIIGQLISSFGFSSLTTTGIATVSEIHEGTFDQVLLSPVNRISYFLGCYMERILLALLEFFVMLVIGLCLGANIPIYAIPGFILAMVFVSISGFMCSFLVSSIFIYTRSVFLVENTLYYAISLLAGVYFSVDVLPSWIACWAKLLPITQCVSMIRNLVLKPRSITTLMMSGFNIILISIPFFLVGYYWFRNYIEKQLIEKVFS